MIGLFPDLYPDELVYSCLSRYAAYAGYLVHRSVAEDLFLNRLDRPSVEFFNALTEDALSHLTAKRYITDMIHDHTMYDYYARFSSTEKRKHLMDMLISGDVKGFNNAISTRKMGERFLRYCPTCAQEDRERYGETYWHRIHQLPEIRVCSRHNYYLCDTEISMSSNKEFAQSTIAQISKLIDQNMLLVLECEDERMLAIYHTKLIHTDWMPADACTVTLKGLDLDAVWENFIVQVGGITIEQGNSLDEQIAADEQRAKLEKEISRLEKLARAEKQPKKKFELVQQIKKLKVGENN